MQSTDSSLINLSASLDGSYTLLEDEEENLEDLEERYSKLDIPNSVASRSFTLIVDVSDSNHNHHISSEPAAQVGV